MKTIIAISLLILFQTTVFAGAVDYISCKGKLIDYDERYHWFENYEFGHSDGISPLAKLKIIHPKKYINRSIGVLFLNQNEKELMSLFENNIGGLYNIKIPKDYLDSDVYLIHSVHLKQIDKLTP